MGTNCTRTRTHARTHAHTHGHRHNHALTHARTHTHTGACTRAHNGSEMNGVAFPGPPSLVLPDFVGLLEQAGYKWRHTQSHSPGNCHGCLKSITVEAPPSRSLTAESLGHVLPHHGPPGGGYLLYHRQRVAALHLPALAPAVVQHRHRRSAAGHDLKGGLGAHVAVAALQCRDEENEWWTRRG